MYNMGMAMGKLELVSKEETMVANNEVIDKGMANILYVQYKFSFLPRTCRTTFYKLPS